MGADGMDMRMKEVHSNMKDAALNTSDIADAAYHHPVGSFMGHAVPGSMFFLVSIYNSIYAFHQYYKSQYSGKPYRSSHSAIFPCLVKSTHVEALIRLALVVSGITGELISGWDGSIHGLVHPMMHSEHCTMFAGFGLSAIIDLLVYHRFAWVPQGADYLGGLAAYLIELILFAYHLHGRTLLNTHVHTLLILVILACCLSTVMEFVKINQLIWALPRFMCGWLQGTWFYHIGFILFHPFHTATWDQNDHENVMKVTMFFSFHVMAAFTAQICIGALVYLRHRHKLTGNLANTSDYTPLLNNEDNNGEGKSHSTQYTSDIDQ